MNGERDLTTVSAFVLGSVLAGGNAVAIRFSNRELDPLWGAALRFCLAAVLMAALLAALRLALPRGRALAGAVVFGVLQFGATFALFYYALVELHAGLGQLLLALVPLLTLLLAVAQRQERLRAVAVVGTLIALVGVGVMTRGALQESLPVLSVLAALGCALCVAQAAVLVRRLPPVHPVTMNAVGMVAGAAVLLVVAFAAGDSFELPDGASTWAAVTYVAAVGSVAVFLLYLFVLGRWVASRAAYTFVLIPVVTVLLSAWLDDEPVGWGLVGGGALVLAGVYVGALREPAGAVEPAEAAR